MIYRAVEGAIKNTIDAHPELEIRPQLRKSIAKRAAGTLMAQLGSNALAASVSSESGSVIHDGQSAQAGVSGSHGAGRVSGFAGPLGGGRLRRSPLTRLAQLLSRDMKGLRQQGLTERVDAFIHVLRTIDRMKKD